MSSLLTAGDVAQRLHELITPEDQRAWERAIEEYPDACRCWSESETVYTEILTH